MSTADNNQYLELENILSFLGINFIDYKGHRTSNGHKNAKNAREIKEFFGKEVMTSGQFIEDIKWWDFKNNWNDLMFLVDKIKPLKRNGNYHYQLLMNMPLEMALQKDVVYNACVEFIKWYNEQKQ